MPCEQSHSDDQKHQPSGKTAVVKLYPALALGMLRQGQAAAGRVWLLLRHLDCSNCGWVEDEQATRQLTAKDEPLRICGHRQWRNLLVQGEGIFWQRRNGRLWLRSVAKVAAALGVERLAGAPVALPLDVLTQGIGVVRAHLYASFHSGRTNMKTGTGGPISRQTLQSISNVSRRSQQMYERRTRVHARRNDAIGPVVGPLAKQEQAWQCGPALYQLVDHHGRYGRPKASYLAWQLPNSYTGPHQRLPRGRQKRINRELVDLFANGMTGNGALPQERFYPHQLRRYCADGKAAGLLERTQKGGRPLYWPASQTRHGRLWYSWETL
jgi:hypothetical protein